MLPHKKFEPPPRPDVRHVPQRLRIRIARTRVPRRVPLLVRLVGDRLFCESTALIPARSGEVVVDRGRRVLAVAADHFANV